MSKYDTKFCKDLVVEIGKFSENEHNELYKILKKNNIKYSKNTNGIFVNLSILDEKKIENIYKFIEFCNQNRINLDKKEEKMNLEKDKIISKNIKEILPSPEKINDNDDEIESEEEEEVMNSKISLKIIKPKYAGIKAKLIKTYKQKNSNLNNIFVYKVKKKEENPKQLDEYDIGEDEYNSIEDKEENDSVEEDNKEIKYDDDDEN